MNRRDGDEPKVPGSPHGAFWGRFFLVRSIPTALYTVKHGTAPQDHDLEGFPVLDPVTSTAAQNLFTTLSPLSHSLTPAAPARLPPVCCLFMLAPTCSIDPPSLPMCLSSADDSIFASRGRPQSAQPDQRPSYGPSATP